jgi:hypothetical protein
MRLQITSALRPATLTDTFRLFHHKILRKFHKTCKKSCFSYLFHFIIKNNPANRKIYVHNQQLNIIAHTHVEMKLRTGKRKNHFSNSSKRKFFSPPNRPDCTGGSVQIHIQWIEWDFSPKVKRTMANITFHPKSSDEVENEWNCTSIFLHVFTVSIKSLTCYFKSCNWKSVVYNRTKWVIRVWNPINTSQNYVD